MRQTVLLIGLDDTDDAAGPGTGRRARELGGFLASKGLGVLSGVTRHQLLVHESIPFTSHNSSLCVALEDAGPFDEVVEVSREFLSGCCAAGSDPGLCVALLTAIATSTIQFGLAAQQRVLSKEEALSYAREHGSIFLGELGGTGGGVIGALAAIGLRASGQDGRFVDLPGIRQIFADTLPARDILDLTAIEAVIDDHGQAIPEEAMIHFGGWLRPNLRQGRPVLLVREQNKDDGVECVGKGWVTIEHKHKNAAK